MAEIFPNEGLDYIMGKWPKGGAVEATMDLRLFSSHSATTVIGTAEGTAQITQSAWTNYAAKTLGTATWGAQSAHASGRSTTYPQVNMGTCGATGGTVNGFYITGNSGSVCVCMANFDDATAVVLMQNDIIRVTPTLVFGP